MTWPKTGDAQLDTFLAKLGRMTMHQVDASLERHNAIEHELEAPDWNRTSALLLHRKIELQAAAFTRKQLERGRAAPPAPTTPVPQSGKT